MVPACRIPWSDLREQMSWVKQLNHCSSVSSESSSAEVSADEQSPMSVRSPVFMMKSARAAISLSSRCATKRFLRELRSGDGSNGGSSAGGAARQEAPGRRGASAALLYSRATVAIPSPFASPVMTTISLPFFPALPKVAIICSMTRGNARRASSLYQPFHCFTPVRNASQDRGCCCYTST